MTEYAATPSSIVYWNGATGASDHIAGTYTGYGQSSFVWGFPGLVDPGIVGFKVVFDASEGDGYLYWDVAIDNPGWPSSPTWTADTASHIGLNNSYDGTASAIRVNGPTHYEHTFFWPGDPTFGGFTFNDPLSDLLISLSAEGGWVSGHLEVGEGPAAASIVVTRFDLVLFTPMSPAPLRIYPRSSTRIYPRRRTRRPGTF
jgi:hypothetical protein